MAYWVKDLAASLLWRGLNTCPGCCCCRCGKKRKKKEKRENRTVPLFFEINYSNIFTNSNDHLGNGSAKFYVIFVFSTNT